MTLQGLNDSKHWRARAAEMRTLADDLRDVETRLLMLDLAADYDTLADRAEERTKTPAPAPSPIRE